MQNIAANTNAINALSSGLSNLGANDLAAREEIMDIKLKLKEASSVSFLNKTGIGFYDTFADNAIGSHCLGSNSNSLGVPFEGNYDTRSEMPGAQFNAWCELKAYLCNIYGNMPVYGHREKGSSECPGANFPLEKVKAANFTNSNKFGWNQNPKGWWYCTSLENGYYYKECWKLIDDEWYLFNSEGYADCNKWTKYKDKWYYLRSNCMMAKNQWLWIDGECYCFDKDGAMYANCTTPDGYRVDETGAWIK